MKIKKILILLICLSQSLFANELTIVAVGEAEQEKEKITLAKPIIEGPLEQKENTKIKELMQIVIDDFKFYRHLFDVSDDLVGVEFDQDLKKVKDLFDGYIVQSKITKKDQKLYVDIKVSNITKSESKILSSIVLDPEDNRRSSHRIANEVYKEIKGKESIFTKSIIFLSDRTSRKNETRKELYTMDFDGKNIRRLTYNNSMIISPAISPDNKKILYSMIESRWRRSSRGTVHKVKNLNLYLFDLDTKKTVKISGRQGINSGAIFTQDPDQIYLTLSLAKNADIYRMNLKTQQISRVTNHLSDDVDPHINSDGSLMTFLSGRAGRAMIYTMNPIGEEQSVKRISYVGRFNASPRFSPDGKEIAFSSWVDNRFDIYKIGSDGRNLVRLTKNFGSNEEPMFSPDGEFIIFTSQRVIDRKNAVQDIYIMNRDGEILSKLTKNFGQCFTPRWSN